MTKKMLIDAAHPEQTRVAIVDGNRVEEFDFESRQKKQLRGNIYLAKVTRVEASLQAAFVEYGGNRHGFLAFNEIHPDYYQIPIEDRLKLVEEEAKATEADEKAEEEKIAKGVAEGNGDEVSEEEDQAPEEAEEAQIAAEAVRKREQRKPASFRRYKIQEVIKPGQILLVQVVKEERGTKGAALTTYLSLAGRYCVLMPNTAKGGGISRKITNAADRKRLKSITAELEVRKGMGLIIRTAGSKRNKTEIKRDYQYLLRVWGQIRELTLESVAPCMVHEEGGLVRRAVRDLYDKDIESILVEGEHAYKEAKSFMKILMPSHTARVKQYTEKYPIFLRYQVEDQLETVHRPEVQLKSGGYLVIHQTEALVAIDVNSGRATKERNIEATALKTNLEAAEEACRQMRLRDLAGLIVIDFIDMEENKNNRAVEKRMKDALKKDRARVQVGRISTFGLFEMSRQRRRASVIEGTSQVCPTCNGLGVVRSIESSALQALQAIESEGMRRRSGKVKLTAPTEVALYILNQKRAQLADIEETSGIRVVVQIDPDLHPPQHNVEFIGEPGDAAARREEKSTNNRNNRRSRNKPRTDEPVEAPEEETEETATTEDEQPDKPKKSRRRGRRGGRGRGRKPRDNSAETDTETAETADTDNEAKADAKSEAEAETDTATEDKPKRKRRTRRSARNAEPEADKAEAAETAPADVEADSDDAPARPKRKKRIRPSAKAADADAETTEEAAEKPKRKRRTRKTAEKPDESQSDEGTAAEAKTEDAKPKRTRRVRASAAKTEAAAKVEEVKPEADAKPKRAPRKRATAKAKAPEAETAEEAPKPKRRRRTTKKADTPAEAKAETVAEDKPKRARRTRPAKAKTDSQPKEAAPATKAEADAPKADTSDDDGPKPKTKRSWRARLFGSQG